MPPLRLPHSSLFITLRCTLKCKLCLAYCPYYDKPAHFTAADIEKTLSRYFSAVDFVEKFTISGGEPMMHEDLSDIIACAMRYEKQFGKLELITNGTLLPNDTKLKAFINAKNKLEIMVDDYGAVSQKASELDKLLEKEGLRHRVRNYSGENIHCGGWIDFGDLTRRLSSPEEISAHYKSCAYSKNICFGICGGKMYICGRTRRCIELNITPIDENEFVDLYSKLPPQLLKEKIRALYGIQTLQACAYCAGMTENSKRYVPAEQAVYGGLKS
jgi:hypothetical protein